CVPVTRLKRRKRRNGFRQSGADGETRYTLESAAARYCIRCKPTHPSPSAHEFRLLLNGLATSALRRMFLQLTAHPALLDMQGPKPMTFTYEGSARPG